MTRKVRQSEDYDDYEPDYEGDEYEGLNLNSRSGNSGADPEEEYYEEGDGEGDDYDEEPGEFDEEEEEGGPETGGIFGDRESIKGLGKYI